MTTATFFLALIGLLILSGVFSGSEIGVYSLSRPRIDAEARQGRPAARILNALLSKKALLLVALLIGNNLVMELATYLAEQRVDRWEGLPSWGREIAVTLVLTPVLFLFGEVLPKDLFRRRPHQLLSLMAPLLWLTKLVLFPIMWPLYGLSKGLERLFRLGRSDIARALRRQEMLQLVEEGTRSGILAPATEDLVRNVLVLQQTRVAQIAIPWERVHTIDLDLEPDELTGRILDSSHARLPAVGRGSVVAGYLHQLDFLRSPDGARKEIPAEERLRPIPAFEPSLPVHKALAQLRVAGQRLALVGTPEKPEGLVTLMDLVSVIAGQAAFRPLSATANHG